MSGDASIVHSFYGNVDPKFLPRFGISGRKGVLSHRESKTAWMSSLHHTLMLLERDGNSILRSNKSAAGRTRRAKPRESSLRANFACSLVSYFFLLHPCRE